MLSLRTITVSVTLVVSTAVALAPTVLAETAKDRFDLKGEVYNTNFKIEMKNGANRDLKTVKAGTYRIKIEDKSSIHNFRLIGPGVNKATAVARKVDSPKRPSSFRRRAAARREALRTAGPTARMWRPPRRRAAASRLHGGDAADLVREAPLSRAL